MSAKPIECYKCKINFAVPDYWHQTRRQDHMAFWCPNGHEQHFAYGPTEEEKLRRERDRLKQQMAQKDDEISEAKAATVAVENKLSRLASKGVCPCCTRSFVNVKRHMATKHPTMFCDVPKLKVEK